MERFLSATPNRTMEASTDSDDELMMEGVPYGMDSAGRPEHTDNITIPEDWTRQHFLFEVAKSPEERAANPSHTISAQHLYGIHMDASYGGSLTGVLLMLQYTLYLILHTSISNK